MNTETIYNDFFTLLQWGLETECAGESVSLSDEEWKMVYRLGVRQGVGVILMDGLQRMIEAGDMEGAGPGKVLRTKWVADCLNQERIAGRQYAAAEELAEVYAAAGMRTVVLKGIAAGTCYPRPLHRPCGDLDCFLMGDYERGNVVAEEAGADVRRGFYKHSHIKFRGLEVENHQFCTAIRGSRRMKAFERVLQGLLKDEGTTMIGETHLENPLPLFNALFLTHHSQRHYLSEGIAMRHLCDWAMLVKVYGKEIDWVRFGQLAAEYGMKDFADACVRLSAKYLGVAVPKGYEVAADEERDKMLLRDLLGYRKTVSYGNKWKTRVALLKNIYSNRYRYRYFSDTTMLGELAKLVWGFIWERKPSLE